MTLPGAKPTISERRQAAAAGLDSARMVLIASARELDGADVDGHMGVLRLIAELDQTLSRIAANEAADRMFDDIAGAKR